VHDAVEKKVQGCGEVKETDELDVVLQYCEEIFGKVVCITELEAEDNNVMEWSDIELETGEKYVGHNCEEVAVQVLDMSGLDLEWEWSNELESGDVYVGQNNCAGVARQVLDMSGLDLEWEWSNVELESGDVYVGQKNCAEVAGKVLDMIGLKADMNYDMEWDWT
jgi:hypothetical protein